MELATGDDGRILTASFGEYKIANIKDIPALQTAIVQPRAGGGPYGSMGIGETALLPTAVIANAVEDAVGVRIAHLPITAERVLDGRGFEVKLFVAFAGVCE